MAVKKKTTRKAATKATATKPKASKVKTSKAKTSTRVKVKKMTTTKTKSKTKVTANRKTAKKIQASEPARVVNRISPPRTTNGEERKARGARVIHQYNYMKAPGIMYDFQVGDKVEVFCDHEEARERVRGWIAGIVVQVDNKMVAVQFRSNVYLTDGWMVPDRILWYPLTSEHIRSAPGGRKSAKKERAIPDY